MAAEMGMDGSAARGQASGAGPAISPESLRCRTVIPSFSCISSRDAGWRSILLDIHSGVASEDPYDSVPTRDPRIGVTLSGRYSAEFYTRGRWRHDAHGPGSINIHRTGEQTRYRFPAPLDPNFRLALIYYPHEQLEAAADHLRKPGQAPWTRPFQSLVCRDPAITQMTFALVGAMQQGAGDFYAETVAAWLAVHMVTRHGSLAGSDDRCPGELHDQRLARVIEFMAANLHRPLTLDQLAAEACISKFHFNRLFTRKVGQSPCRYLAGLRLDAAREMLGCTDLPVAQVGASCGYPAPSPFAAAFQARFGMSPSACRKIARQRAAG